MAFQPVPTYEDPAEVNPKTGRFAFSPVWLSWFLTLTNGGLSSSVRHNSLIGLQGGDIALSQFYHLTLAQVSTIPFRNTGAVSGIVPTGSPYTYTNADGFDEDIVVVGGTVSSLQFVRSPATVLLGMTQGIVHLSPGDGLIISYASIPTVTKVPR